MIKKLLTNWKFMAALIIVALFAWQYLSGFSQARGLFKQVLSGIVEDKTEIVETLEAAVNDYEKQIEDHRAEIRRLRASNQQQEDIIDALKKKLAGIVVPDNPDDLILDLQKRGIGPIRKRVLR